MRLPFSALLALFAALPAPTGIQAAAVKWQVVPENNSSPLTTTESPANSQIEPAASAPRWQRLDGSPAGSTAPVRWAEAPQTPVTPAAPAIAKQAIPKPQAIARSVGRAFSYGGVLYPEVGLRVPTAFRQDVAYKVQLSSIFRGTSDGSCAGFTFPTFDTRCTDLMYEAEINPLIWGPLSFGINYSQQESLFDSSADSGGNTTKNGIGSAFGFQIKANLTDSTGLAVVGLNLLADKAGPIGKSSYENVQADQGQAYLFIASQSIKLGKWFGSNDLAMLTLTGGIGNGRYKSATHIISKGYNYGPYGPIGSVAVSFNSRWSIFGEWAGQNVGIGTSLKPFKVLPVTLSILYRDWKGLSTGYTQEKNGVPVNINCGYPEQCGGTIDGRLTWSF